MRELYNISVYAQLAGSIIIVISCLHYFKKRPQHIKMLCLYALASISFSIGQFISNFFLSNAHLTTIGNAFVLSEAFFFSLIYYYVTDVDKIKKWILVSFVLYISFYSICFVILEARAFSLVRFGRDSWMIAYALGYFYYLIRKLPEENLLKLPMFWINSAVLFFFSSTFILSFMVDSIVTALGNDVAGFWAFRNYFRFLFCLALSYAAWLDWRSVKTAAG